MAVELARYRFSLDQYERMVETGVLTEDDRVELIRGEIVELPPINVEHSFVVQRLARLFIERLGDRAYVRVQDAVRLPPDSEPEPDVVLARPPDTRYLRRRRHPEPQDIFLIVEVTYTTHPHLRGARIPLYARSGIGELWLVDGPAERIEVYRKPDRARYGEVDTLGRGSGVSPLAFPDVQIAVDEVLP